MGSAAVRRRRGGYRQTVTVSDEEHEWNPFVLFTSNESKKHVTEHRVKNMHEKQILQGKTEFIWCAIKIRTLCAVNVDRNTIVPSLCKL